MPFYISFIIYAQKAHSTVILSFVNLNLFQAWLVISSSLQMVLFSYPSKCSYILIKCLKSFLPTSYLWEGPTNYLLLYPQHQAQHLSRSPVNECTKSIRKWAKGPQTISEDLGLNPMNLQRTKPKWFCDALQQCSVSQQQRTNDMFYFCLHLLLGYHVSLSAGHVTQGGSIIVPRSQSQRLIQVWARNIIQAEPGEILP